MWFVEFIVSLVALLFFLLLTLCISFVSCVSYVFSFVALVIYDIACSVYWGDFCTADEVLLSLFTMFIPCFLVTLVGWTIFYLSVRFHIANHTRTIQSLS